jgi:hypothetical protein
MEYIDKEMRDVMLLNDSDLYSYNFKNHIVDPPIPQILEEDIFKGGMLKRNLAMFHQNIRGLVSNKIYDLTIYLQMSPIHVLCITEHHLGCNEIETIYLPNYNLNAKYCRTKLKKGGVCIFTHKTIHCTSINLNNFCKEQDLEICAIELHIPTYRICIVTVYRSPSGDFVYFLNTLEKILNKIYNNATDIIFCGDFNVNYHINSSFKKSMDSLLTSYGISSVVIKGTKCSQSQLYVLCAMRWNS